jgi:threonylcarbamoyladenosine tRNA methylthiotransferase MtaB
MRDGLYRKAFEEESNPRAAELVIVNSCTVTQRTDQQVRQTVRKLHRENPTARIVVTGCYAERDPQALAALPGVTLVAGNARRDSLAEALSESGRAARAEILRAPIAGISDYALPPMSRIGSRTRPLVKLQDGCDSRCSYCIVPFVRGQGRSARPEAVLREITQLVRLGYQEIVLTGVHLGAYGCKLNPPENLVDLLRKILALPGLGRLRLSSIEPMRFSRDIIRLAADNPIFAPHFHVPVQSGSDRILRRMRRPYTASRFLDLLAFIRERLPTAGLGTDVLAGFPGETDADFEKTCEVISQSPLTYLHVFPFSARQGTDAFFMPDMVPHAVIKERARILREISRARNFEFRERFAGQVLPGIGLARAEEMGESVVLTDNYISVLTRSDHFQPNRLVKTRIDEVRSNETWGTVIPSG